MLKKVHKGTCPICGEEIIIDDPVIREILDCPYCSNSLEVAEITEDKVHFILAEMEGEDWGE